MSDGSISLNECIKKVLLSGADNISHVTFFIEHVGIIRIPFDEFIILTKEIKVDSRYLTDLQALLSIFSDNFCFVDSKGHIKYTYSVTNFKNTNDEYGVISIDPVGENSRWNTYDAEHKRSLIRAYLKL